MHFKQDFATINADETRRCVFIEQIQRFWERHQVTPDEILSVYRQGRHTVLCSQSGAEIYCTDPMHQVLEALPTEDFLSISRSAIVRRDKIMHISSSGVYTMADGKTFQGRTRYLSTHRKLKKELEARSSGGTLFLPAADFYDKYSILDRMPVAYCIIELLFDENGHGIDFIFRYCNYQMEQVEGIPIQQMLNRSFYEVFKNGDKKWLVAYADTALNGTPHTLHDYSPEIGKTLTIHCYQPEANFCACVLIPDEQT